MIKDLDTWKKWEMEFKQKERLDIYQKFKIFDALYEEAKMLGKFPPDNPLDGIERKIRMARILNDTEID